MNADLLFPRHRVVRRFLFSDEHGRPKPFNGTVVRLEGQKGELQVQGLSRRIPFFSPEANRPDLRRNDDLRDFYIAFNMLGPIVEFRVTASRA